MNKVKIQDLEKVLEPLFYNWRCKRRSKESFGDFTTRMVSATLTIFSHSIISTIYVNFAKTNKKKWKKERKYLVIERMCSDANRFFWTVILGIWETPRDGWQMGGCSGGTISV